MKMARVSLLVLGLLLSPNLLWAGELKLITSSSIPPYVIAASDRGIVVDLMREALALKGYDINFQYSTNRRVMEELQEHRVDAAFNFPPGELPGFFYSSVVVEYQNVAVTLASRHLQIDKIADLQDKRLIAFQNSTLFLGPEYAQMLKANSHHDEVNDQRSQVFMLYMGRTDVVVMERRIFLYYLAQLRQQPGYEAAYEMHPIFPTAPRFAVFASAKVRDDFNDGLRTLRGNGRYDAIVQQYLEHQSPPPEDSTSN